MSRVIQERVSKLGLRSFDEETYRWILAILLAKVIEKTGQWPKYEQVHQWLLQWKRDYTTLKTPWPFDVIVNYPPSPSMLPADVYSYAYSPSDPPITKAIANFQSMAAHHIPLRKNSNLLVREAEATARLTGLSLSLDRQCRNLRCIQAGCKACIGISCNFPSATANSSADP